MTVAVAFDTPSLTVRSRIAARAAEAHGVVLVEAELNDLVRVAAEPAIMAAGMQVAQLTGRGSIEARLGIESILKAQGRSCPAEPLLDDCYDFTLAAADCDLAELADKLVQTKMPGWSLLLAGPSGTGKSAYAKYLAQRMDIELMEYRGSDLLGAFVGETEKQIAAAFSRAAERNAMLLIDEADSFLFRREPGQRRWEAGMVNEMLRWTEQLRAPFVATTNLADLLDPAMQRRFTVRVNFETIVPQQIQALFMARFNMEPPANVLSVTGLTPGDFAVVAHRASLLGENRPEILSDWLMKEVMLRGEKQSTFGFHAP